MVVSPESELFAGVAVDGITQRGVVWSVNNEYTKLLIDSQANIVQFNLPIVSSTRPELARLHRQSYCQT